MEWPIGELTAESHDMYVDLCDGETGRVRVLPDVTHHDADYGRPRCSVWVCHPDFLVLGSWFLVRSDGDALFDRGLPPVVYPGRDWWGALLDRAREAVGPLPVDLAAAQDSY